MRSKGIKRTLVMILIVCMAVTMGASLTPGALSFAASTIGRVKLGGSERSFSTLGELVDYVDDLKGKTFTIEMDCNWDAYDDGSFNKRLEIPSNCNATFNMNGHIFDRYRTSYDNKGEVIEVGSGSTLTINGNTQNGGTEPHTVVVYKDTSINTETVTMFGGVLSGGFNSNGGGCIDLNANCTLNLNRVTIAGNRAAQTWGSDGYGGGIWIHGKNATVNMVDSTITGNFAYNDGGGIYQSNEDGVCIYMKRSHIDSNFCGDEGGGVNLDGESLILSGDGESTINNNECKGAHGGGIYLWNDEASVSGLIISGNKSGSEGGGIYSKEETITLAGLTMTGNRANVGGAIYVNNDNTTVSGCTITGNTATEKGGGVYVADDVDEGFYVSGGCVIKDNTNGNLYLNDKSDDYVNFELGKGADVHIYVRELSASYKLLTEGTGEDGKGKNSVKVKSSNCIQYITPDNSGYHLTYNSAPNYRKIYLVKDGESVSNTGEPYTPATKVDVPAMESTPVVTGTVTGSSGKEYDLIRGYYKHQDVESGAGDGSEGDTTAVFYYSDGFFDSDPTVYDQHLATASLNMAMAGCYLWAGADDYSNKHAAGRQFLADIGVEDNDIYCNDYNIQKPGTDTIGVTMGAKALKDKNGNPTGKVLVPITMRSAGYESEWASNMTLGDGSEKNGEDRGWAEAADIVTSEIEYFASRNETVKNAMASNNVIFWIVGYSRGGATANLTAKRLVEKYPNQTVFGYTFEAPRGGVDKAENVSPEKYYCIHNTVNAADLVPYVAFSRMGFKRYGVDHYVPGTATGSVQVTTTTDIPGAGSASGVTSMTTYRDNDPIYTKTDAYNTLRDTKMLGQLRAVDSGMIFDDYFHIAGIKIITTGDHIQEVGSYDVKAETYIADFVKYLQEWGRFDRYSYVHNKVSFEGKEYHDIQDAMRESIAMIFGMSEENSEGFISRATSIMNRLSYVTLTGVSLQDVYDDCLGDWHELSDSEKMKYINFFWNKIEESGAFDYLTSDQLSQLENNWPVIADLVFWILDDSGDYDTEVYSGAGKLTISGTLAYNVSRIFANHYPEVNLAWVRTQDSYYDNELTGYRLVSPESISDPGAYTLETTNGNTEKIVIPASETTKLKNDHTVYLDNEELRGEAIYYNLIDSTNGTTQKDQLFRGGIPLAVKGDNVSTEYAIEATSKFYNVGSYTSRFYVKVLSGKHKVTFDTLVDKGNGPESQTTSANYGEGDTVTAYAFVPSNKFFRGWTVTDGQNHDVSENIQVNSGYQMSDPYFVFTMPNSGGDSVFDDEYALNFKANYGDRIQHIDLIIDAPQAGVTLTNHAVAEWGTGDSKERRVEGITWSYTDTDATGKEYTVASAGKAFNSTVYTAYLRIPQDESMLFMPDITVSLYDGIDGEIIDYSRDDDGVLNVTIRFAETASAGGEDRPDLEDMSSVTIQLVDLNRFHSDDDFLIGEDVVYYVQNNATVIITVPNLDSYVFTEWNDRNTGLVPVGSENSNSIEYTNTGGHSFTIYACYKPVVHNITINDLRAPIVDKYDNDDGNGHHAGDPVRVQTKVDNITVTMDKTYKVSFTVPSNVTYNPHPKADKPTLYTTYTAGITIAPRGSFESVTITDPDTGKTYSINGNFAYADDLKATVNGDDAVCDTSTGIVYYTFPATPTALLSIGEPQDVYDVPYGSTTEEIMALLPATDAIETVAGTITEADIQWDHLIKISGDEDPVGPSTWLATGFVKLSEFVVNNRDIDLEVTVNVYVNGAEKAKKPMASRESGTYEESFAVTLTTETEGGTIYYTVDGSDPFVNGQEYDGETIAITREASADGIFTLRAYTAKEGLQNSTESVYDYRFTNDISVPKDVTLPYIGESQIGVAASENYTLTIESGRAASIDEDGNAVATIPGTYLVRASLVSDELNWALKDEEGNVTTTKEDQIITFVITEDGYDEDGVIRIYGSNRFLTSFKVADVLKEKLDVEKFDAVILAYGMDYPDALAGSYLSCMLDAPILLVDSNASRIQEMQDYVKANLNEGGKIYMLGGKGVVPEEAVAGLDDYEAVRLGGKNRFLTNLLILEEGAKMDPNVTEILVTSGYGFADSLSAAATGKPILLVGKSLTDDQKDYLDGLEGDLTFTAIGGKGAVGEEVMAELEAYGATDRVGGKDRFQTSVAVAGKYFKKPEKAVLAYAMNFPDGLCGGALAYTMEGPLILTAENFTGAAVEYCEDSHIATGAVLGGPKLISDESVRAIFGLSENAIILVK